MHWFWWWSYMGALMALPLRAQNDKVQYITWNTHSFVLLFRRIYASMTWVSIGSGIDLSPVRRQAITWTNAGFLLIALLRTNFSEIWVRILSFWFRKMHLKFASAKMSAILSRGRWFNPCGIFTHIPQDCFTGTKRITWASLCQWS